MNYGCLKKSSTVGREVNMLYNDLFKKRKETLPERWLIKLQQLVCRGMSLGLSRG